MKRLNGLSVVAALTVISVIFSYVIYGVAKKLAEFNESVSKYSTNHDMGD